MQAVRTGGGGGGGTERQFRDVLAKQLLNACGSHITQSLPALGCNAHSNPDP